MKHQGLHFLVGGPQASLPLGVLGLLCKGVVGKAKKGGRQSVPPAPRAVITQESPGRPAGRLSLRVSATYCHLMIHIFVFEMSLFLTRGQGWHVRGTPRAWYERW